MSLPNRASSPGKSSQQSPPRRTTSMSSAVIPLPATSSQLAPSLLPLNSSVPLEREQYEAYRREHTAVMQHQPPQLYRIDTSFAAPAYQQVHAPGPVYPSADPHHYKGEASQNPNAHGFYTPNTPDARQHEVVASRLPSMGVQPQVIEEVYRPRQGPVLPSLRTLLSSLTPPSQSPDRRAEQAPQYISPTNPAAPRHQWYPGVYHHSQSYMQQTYAPHPEVVYQNVPHPRHLAQYTPAQARPEFQQEVYYRVPAEYSQAQAQHQAWVQSQRVQSQQMQAAAPPPPPPPPPPPRAYSMASAPGYSHQPPPPVASIQHPGVPYSPTRGQSYPSQSSQAPAYTYRIPSYGVPVSYIPHSQGSPLTYGITASGLPSQGFSLLPSQRAQRNVPVEKADSPVSPLQGSLTDPGQPGVDESKFVTPTKPNSRIQESSSSDRSQSKRLSTGDTKAELAGSRRGSASRPPDSMTHVLIPRKHSISNSDDTVELVLRSRPAQPTPKRSPSSERKPEASTSASAGSPRSIMTHSRRGSRKEQRIKQPPMHIQPRPTNMRSKESRTIKPKRKRATYTQVRRLNEVFQQTFFPSSELRLSLAQQLGMTPRAVQIWFQNRRQGWRMENSERTLQGSSKSQPRDGPRPQHSRSPITGTGVIDFSLPSSPPSGEEREGYERMCRSTAVSDVPPGEMDVDESDVSDSSAEDDLD